MTPKGQQRITWRQRAGQDVLLLLLATKDRLYVATRLTRVWLLLEIWHGVQLVCRRFYKFSCLVIESMQADFGLSQTDDI